MTRPLHALLNIAATALLSGCASGPTTAERDAAELVRRHTAAFNAHDVGAMLANVGPDFAWYDVGQGTMTTQAGSRDDLEAGMKGYFKAIPSARAELERVHPAGPYVVVRERAFWRDGTDREQSQASLGVDRVIDGMIEAVWYFPAER